MVSDVANDLLFIMPSDIFKDVFIGGVIGEEFSIAELFKRWVDVNVDTVVSIDELGNESVHIEFRFVVEIIL